MIPFLNLYVFPCYRKSDYNADNVKLVLIFFLSKQNYKSM